MIPMRALARLDKWKWFKCYISWKPKTETSRSRWFFLFLYSTWCSTFIPFLYMLCSRRTTSVEPLIAKKNGPKNKNKIIENCWNRDREWADRRRRTHTHIHAFNGRRGDDEAKRPEQKNSKLKIQAVFRIIFTFLPVVCVRRWVQFVSGSNKSNNSKSKRVLVCVSQ